MPSFADVLTKDKPPISSGKFEVAVTSPFQVYLDGGATAVDGVAVDGLSYSVGTTGQYFLIEGQRPLCVPTA